MLNSQEVLDAEDRLMGLNAHDMMDKYTCPAIANMLLRFGSALKPNDLEFNLSILVKTVAVVSEAYMKREALAKAIADMN